MSARPPPFTFAIETIPWEQCARLVQERKALNRPLALGRVDTLARSVAGRRFYLTHQGVALDPAGNLIDGQHRIAAHAKTKTDFTGLVCRYTDAAYAQEVMAIFDSGRSRTMADGLAIGGVMPEGDARDMTAVCNVLLELTGPTQSRSRDLQETAEFYKLHRAAVRWSIAAIPKKRGGAYVRAAFALAWERAPEKVAELAAQIQTGSALPGTAAALWNRAQADGLMSTQGGAAVRRDVALRALRILKAHVTGEATPAKLFTTPEALMWFLGREEAPGAQAAPARLSAMEVQLLEAIPAEGAQLGAIAKAAQTSGPNARRHLARMENIGAVHRPRVGFYTRPAVAAE